MNAKDMLDKATKIIARGDVTGSNRELLLFFMNTARKAILRDKAIRKLYGYKTISHVNGIISDTSIKHAKTIEYVMGTDTKLLTKIKNFDKARELYPDFTITGTPKHYLEVGTEIRILPIPEDLAVIADNGDFSVTSTVIDFGGFTTGATISFGTVNIYGEFWPDDLTDSEDSSDVITVELPEAFIYLAAAEYLDYFDETDKGSYWRSKGMEIVNTYVKEDKKNALYRVGLNSDPFGNRGDF